MYFSILEFSSSFLSCYVIVKEQFFEWWDWLDSNQRPRPYQGRTLTS
jgi:hypothetical protein